MRQGVLHEDERHFTRLEGGDGAQREAAGVEQIEPTGGAVAGANGLGDLVEPFDAVGGIIYGRGLQALRGGGKPLYNAISLSRHMSKSFTQGGAVLLVHSGRPCLGKHKRGLSLTILWRRSSTRAALSRFAL